MFNKQKSKLCLNQNINVDVQVVYHLEESLLPQDRLVVTRAMQVIEDISCVRQVNSVLLYYCKIMYCVIENISCISQIPTNSSNNPIQKVLVSMRWKSLKL